MEKTPILLWEQKIDESDLLDLGSNIISDNIIYTSFSQGEIYTLNAQKTEQTRNVQKEPEDRIHMPIIFSLLTLLGVALIIRTLLKRKEQEKIKK